MLLPSWLLRWMDSWGLKMGCTLSVHWRGRTQWLANGFGARLHSFITQLTSVVKPGWEAPCMESTHRKRRAKRREWMGCWGLLGCLLIVSQCIIPENSLRLASVSLAALPYGFDILWFSCFHYPIFGGWTSPLSKRDAHPNRGLAVQVGQIGIDNQLLDRSSMQRTSESVRH